MAAPVVRPSRGAADFLRVVRMCDPALGRFAAKALESAYWVTVFLFGSVIIQVF